MRRLLTALALAAATAVGAAGAAQPDLGTEAQREAGRVHYEKYCSQCHGEKGDGKGPAAARLKPRPRDFTSGTYKIRSTPSGTPPTTRDLVNIIRKGLPYTSMPPWPLFSDAEVTDLAYYIKSFSPVFADAAAQADPMDLPEPPAFSEDSAKQGEAVYKEIGCAQCHGELGRGDGTSAPTLKDDWGHHIRPADLSKRWTFRGGPGRKDIFRAFTTALSGSPMPSYADSLSVEKRWQLTDYIWSLSPADDPGYDAVVVAPRLDREIDLADAPALFEKAQPAYFPVIGQIMEPGRAFYPSANGVTVRAAYNDSDVAFELSWDDMRAETTGKNSPALPVPAAEDDQSDEAAGAGAAEPAAGEDDFWGEEPASGKKAAPPPAKPAAEEDDFWAEEGSTGAAAGSAATGPAGEFSDAVAIQFPSVIPAGNVKPYFIFGDGQNAVDLWFLDLASKRPEMFIGHGSANLESQGKGQLDAAASYDRGRWTVVFKRPLREGGVAFQEGRFLPLAFSVWDGFNRERGNKRGLTRWVSFYLEPAAGQQTSPTRTVAAAVAVTLVLELVLIGAVRRRRNSLS